MSYPIPQRLSIEQLITLLRPYFVDLHARVAALEARREAQPVQGVPNPEKPVLTMDLASNKTLTIQDLNAVLYVNCTVASTLTFPMPYPGSWSTIVNTGTATATLSDGTNTLGTVTAGHTSELIGSYATGNTTVGWTVDKVAADSYDPITGSPL